MIWMQLLFVLATDGIIGGCNAAVQRDRRIVGGDIAMSSQVPYLVNIRKNGLFHCGGALVTRNCVLTAAHCVKSAGESEFVVRAGATYLSDLQAANRRVDKIFIPEQYNYTNFEHDIAIFRLRNSIKTNKHIKTISLANIEPKRGDLIRISGWGLTHENATAPPNRMRTARVRVMRQDLCRALYTDYREVSDTMFCASIPGHKDACLADSGGPAVMNGNLVGIVSWGRGLDCGRAESPGVYVNVFKMRLWIYDTIHKYCY